MVQTCTHISAIRKLIWFSFVRLMHRHVIHILLHFQINILNSFEVNKFFSVPTLGEQQTCHALQGRGGNLPG